MIVRLAYHDSTVSVCYNHYENPPQDAPALGPVRDSRMLPTGCEYCHQEQGRVRRFRGATDVI